MTNLLQILRTTVEAYRFGTATDFEKYSVRYGDITPFCTELDEYGCPTEAGIEGAKRFITVARNWTPLAWRLYGAWKGIENAAIFLRCELLGHDWRDES